MQYIHQATYGSPGGVHTAKPLFAYDKNHFYEMKGGRPDTKAVYQVRGSQVYATSYHPNGGSPHAMFTIQGNKIHTTEFHPNHNPAAHVFEIHPGA